MVAKGLLEHGNSEIHWRMAAARAYYAVIHYVLSELQVDPAKASGRTHELVGRLLNDEGAGSAPGIREAKKHLRTLREAREQADYECTHDFNRSTATMLVRLAERILSTR